jgi:hypothetical protein
MAFGPGASGARPYFLPGAAAGDHSGNTTFGIALRATRQNSSSVRNTCTRVPYGKAAETTRRLAVVKSQQFCFGEGDGSGAPIQIDNVRLPLEYRT